MRYAAQHASGPMRSRTTIVRTAIAARRGQTSETSPRRLERCVLSKRARALTPSCASPLLASIEALESRQARSRSAVVDHYANNPILLPSFSRDRFWSHPQGAQYWCVMVDPGRSRPSLMAL